ncbi:MAG: ABC transporter permease [Thermoflexales bacterium]|nr:ABC transporter permease [Thermoflexales bacterium]
MRRHITRRLLLLLPTLLLVSFVTFTLLRLIPGDPAQVMLGERANAEQRAHFRAVNGLDRPVLVQYVRYVSELARGDWGRAIVTNLPVTTELAYRLPATVELGLAAMALACLLGVPAGVWAAYRRGTPLDWLASGGTLVGASMPLFWLGLLLAYVFSYRLGWLPPSGRLAIGLKPASQFDTFDLISNFYILHSFLTGNWAALADALKHLVLPALTLSTVPLASITRMTRACVLDVLAQDYIRTARAKGLPKHAVLFRHALENAWPPVFTVVGLQLGSLFSGAILTETIFAWPGLGQLVAERVLARDYPLVQGVVLLSALLFVCLNLFVDLACAWLNPRIRYE